MSARGFDFSVREADICFIGGRDEAETRAASLRAKDLAAKLGKTIKTYAMCTVIYGGSDAAAEAIAQKYRDGLDEGAVLGMLESYGATFAGADNAMVARAKGAFMTHTVIGAPKTCAQKIAAFLHDCALDGLMLIFADYREGLRVTGREILPRLRGLLHDAERLDRTVAHRSAAGRLPGGFRGARWRAWPAGLSTCTLPRRRSAMRRCWPTRRGQPKCPACSRA